MKIIYTHFSQDPIEKFEEKIYEQPPELFLSSFKKPKGFWVSINNGWEDWLDANGYVDSWGYKNLYKVIIPKKKKIYHLDPRKDALYHFHKQFGYKRRLGESEYLEWHVDWCSFIKKYDGIQITPYNWRFIRYRYNWYYSLDCSSCVLWNTHGVKIEKLNNRIIL